MRGYQYTKINRDLHKIGKHKCTGCSEVLAWTEDNFYRSRHTLSSKCHACWANYYQHKKRGRLAVILAQAS